MNKAEQEAVEQFHERREREAQEKQDDLEAELWWKKNFKIFERMDIREGYKYLCDQGLRVGVLEKVKKIRLAQLNKVWGKNCQHKIVDC